MAHHRFLSQISIAIGIVLTSTTSLTNAFTATLHQKGIKNQLFGIHSIDGNDHCRRSTSLKSSTTDDVDINGKPSAMDRFNRAKEDLFYACESSDPSTTEVLSLTREVEEMGEQVGVGQAPALSGFLAGEWTLLYASEDTTRSSPFFWAFRNAVPDKSDQIFSITDAIPPPIKEIGPAIQTISLDKGTNSGTLVSRVEVSTLGGYAKSTMTTRCTVLGVEGLDCLRVRVDTTKPEKWTILQVFGSLGESVIENAPPFPSGEALEKVKKGSSEVLIKTTFCDGNLRISKDPAREGEVYIWKRNQFSGDISI